MSRPRYFNRSERPAYGQRTLPLMASMIRACRLCGCTDQDCSGCIARTGQPCRWVAQDLCSACELRAAA